MASESGGAQTSDKLGLKGLSANQKISHSGMAREGQAKRVKLPYTKWLKEERQKPEYVGTRGILTESAGTIPQG